MINPQKKFYFNIRYYLGNYEHYNFAQLVEHFNEDSLPITFPAVQIGNYIRRICICSNQEFGDSSISGYFITYRDDIIQKGNKKTGEEELIELNDEESIIEKNYFVLFIESKSEFLVYHNSSLLGGINNFNSYITNLSSHLNQSNEFSNMTMLEIGAENIITGNKPLPTLKKIEYKLARPADSELNSNEDKWVQDTFDSMKENGVSMQKITMINNSKGGLAMEVWNHIKALYQHNKTKTLKVTPQLAEQPIDLLHDILKDRFFIFAKSRKEIQQNDIFNKIRELKETRNDILSQYIKN